MMLLESSVLFGYFIYFQHFILHLKDLNGKQIKKLREYYMEMMLLFTTITFISMASQLLMEQQNCLDAGNSSLDCRRRLRF